MRKLLFLPLLFAFYFSLAQNTGRLLDQPMQLKSAFIKIDADLFTAVTFIEMEFYNPHHVEMEGLYQFQLHPGQVITDFQLDLNGNYRDGSIEEKWKARNAYNTIVGKRVDPALLQMDWKDHYRLNVYPIPAKSSRKITMTIQQLMKPGDKWIDYILPLDRKDTTAYLKMDINVHSQAMPFVQKGLLELRTFANSSNSYHLSFETNNISLSKPVWFSIPLSNESFRYCIKAKEQKNYFGLHYKPQTNLYGIIHPKTITVFWDVSGSAGNRNIGKEISFLQQYISWHDIREITIIPFNHKIKDTVVFDMDRYGNDWKQYLRSLSYDGATQLGILDFSQTSSDAIFLFSDGRSTYGKSIPKAGNALVYCINSSNSAAVNVLTTITGTGGGSYIDLNKTMMNTAIDVASRSQNWLLNITSSSGKTVYEQQLPVKIGQSVFLNGIIPDRGDTLFFHFGTNSKITKIEKVHIANRSHCFVSAIDRIDMLSKAEMIEGKYNWEDILEFGLKEKIVTLNTAFIVLEKVEDYIKYNIAPPKDLKEKCEEMNYVKKDTRTWRRQLRDKDDFLILSDVVNAYNNKIRQWDKNASEIKLTQFDMEQTQLNLASNSQNANAVTNSLDGRAAGIDIIGGENRLDEVVVVGYGSQSKRSLTGSVSTVHSNALSFGYTDIASALQGRVAGVEITSSGAPGSIGSVRIRGASTLSGNNEPLFVLDGMPVSGNINGFININDIDNIQVLKDASATALYGSRASNGVIVINSKKGKYHYGYSYPRSPYRLKDMEDVEYLQQVKDEPLNSKYELYEELKNSYGSSAGFYFDMAQHFFEVNMKKEALEILMNASEVAQGDYSVIKAMGYVLESWKYFDEAINAYQQVLDMNPMNLNGYRDLAWAYYQNGDCQVAIDILFAGIKKNFETEEQYFQSTKAIMLSEMNAIIELHKAKLNISAIPSSLIRSMPVDIRIVVDGNETGFSELTIYEPGGAECSSRKPISKNDGYLNKGYNNFYYYYNGPQEYQMKSALKGRYRIRVNYYDYSNSPSFIRITTFKNFGKDDQSISIQHAMMDNQYGTIEIGEVNW